MSKVALMSDIHYHLWTAFSPDGGRSRLADISNVMHQLLDYCLANDIKHVALLGDIFEKRGVIDSYVYNTFAQDIKQFLEHGIKLYILAGNHDQDLISNATWDNSLAPLSGLFGGLKIVSEPEELYIENRQILFLPYIHDHKVVEKLINKSNAEFAFIHAGIIGAKLTDSDYRIKSGLDVGAIRDTCRIYSGHYHTPQTVGIATYLGSPIHHTFNDYGQEKSFIVLDLDDSTYIRVPTKYPRFMRETVTDLSAIYKIASDDFYKIRVVEKTLTTAHHDHLRANTKAYEIDYTFKSESQNYFARFDTEQEVLRKFIQREFDSGHRELFREAKKYLC